MTIDSINGYAQFVSNQFAWNSFGYQGQYFNLSAAEDFMVARFKDVLSNCFSRHHIDNDAILPVMKDRVRNVSA